MSHSTVPRAQVETITPAKAHQLLATKEHTDRNVSEKHVKRLADDMRLGFWVVNGESIKINRAGEVVDGQHRLHACIKADKEFATLVVRDLPTDEQVQYTTDSGRRRSIGDALKIRGESYTHEIAGGIAFQYRFLTRSLHRLDAPSVPVALKLMDRFGGDPDGPGFRHSAARVSKLRHQGRVSVSGSLATWGHFVFGELERRNGVAKGTNEAFWEGLYLGVELIEDDPRLHLRNRFIDHSSPLKTARTMSRSEMIALTIKAWNRFADGQTMSTNALRWVQVGPTKEPFPQLDQRELLEDWFRIRL